MAPYQSVFVGSIAASVVGDKLCGQDLRTVLKNWKDQYQRGDSVWLAIQCLPVSGLVPRLEPR